MAENIKRKTLAVISALAGLMFFVALVFFFTGGGSQQPGSSRQFRCDNSVAAAHSACSGPDSAEKLKGKGRSDRTAGEHS